MIKIQAGQKPNQPYEPTDHYFDDPESEFLSSCDSRTSFNRSLEAVRTRRNCSSSCCRTSFSSSGEGTYAFAAPPVSSAFTHYQYPTSPPPIQHNNPEKGGTYPVQYDAAPPQLSTAATRRPDSRARSPDARGRCRPYSLSRRGRWCRCLV